MRSTNYIVFVVYTSHMFPCTKRKFQTFVIMMTRVVISLMNTRWDEGTSGINLHVSVLRCVTVDAN